MFPCCLQFPVYGSRLADPSWPMCRGLVEVLLKVLDSKKRSSQKKWQDPQSTCSNFLSSLRNLFPSCRSSPPSSQSNLRESQAPSMNMSNAHVGTTFLDALYACLPACMPPASDECLRTRACAHVLPWISPGIWFLGLLFFSDLGRLHLRAPSATM